jgi:hypothetical protein
MAQGIPVGVLNAGSSLSPSSLAFTLKIYMIECTVYVKVMLLFIETLYYITQNFRIQIELIMERRRRNIGADVLHVIVCTCTSN